MAKKRLWAVITDDGDYIEELELEELNRILITTAKHKICKTYWYYA